MLVGLFSLAVLLVAMGRSLNLFDEGIVFVAAMRILHGDLIHRDFYSIYGPGQYYVAAALIRLFHDGFLAVRIYDLVVRAGVVTVLFAVIRMQAPLRTALAFALCGVCWFVAMEHYLFPMVPCILLSMIGSTLIVRADGARLRLFAAGLSTGLATLVRYDMGFFIAAAHTLALLALTCLAPLPAATRLRRIVREVLAYGAGIALVFGPAAVAFLASAPFSAFWADIIDFPSHYYAATRSLPFPRLRDIATRPAQLAVYLPALAAGVALFELVRRRRRLTAPLEIGDASLVVFGIAAAILCAKGVVRVSWTDMFMGTVPGLVVLAVAITRWWGATTGFRIASLVIVAWIGIPVTDAGLHFVKGYRWHKQRLLGPWLASQAGLLAPDPGEFGCDLRPFSKTVLVWPDYVRVTRYLWSHSRPGDKILAAVGRHDKVYVNALGLSFTTGLMPGTHWAQYDPGLQTRADIQQGIIEDLQRNDVRWVIHDTKYDAIEEPNDSARSSGVKLLDAFLDQHYHRVASSEDVAVWLRNGEDPGPATGDPCEASP